MSKYVVSKRGNDSVGGWYSQPVYHNDYQMTYASPTSSYYVLVRRSDKRELPKRFHTRAEAKAHAARLSK